MQPNCENPQLPPDERPRVLVIEPNRRYLGVIAKRLHEQGYRVVTADNAHSGLAELHRVAADLVLSEARLPGTGGTELVRMIRDNPTHGDVPVLLMVGRTDAAGAIRAFEAGADGVVRKPFHFEVLGACIARQLVRARAVRQLLHDNAALDARLVGGAIEIGEIRSRLQAAEAERTRLQTIVERPA